MYSDILTLGPFAACSRINLTWILAFKTGLEIQHFEKTQTQGNAKLKEKLKTQGGNPRTQGENARPPQILLQ